MATAGQSTCEAARGYLWGTGHLPGVLRIRPGGDLGCGPIRDLNTAVSPSYADRILATKKSGTTDDDLQYLVAEAIADAYFRREGGARAGLHVEFADVEWLDIRF